MHRMVKSQVMLAVLKLAPMGRSLDQFERYAAQGDVDAMWKYIEAATRHRPDVGRSIEGAGRISFETLRPALEAIYRLRESAGV